MRYCTDLGKSLTCFMLNPSLQLLVYFVSQEHDGNILSCTLLQKKKRIKYGFFIYQ